MIIRAVIMINPKKVEEYFRWSKNRISSADEIAKLTFARPPLSTTPYTYLLLVVTAPKYNLETLTRGEVRGG